MRNQSFTRNPGSRRVAIACGGTGGHLFPGIAIGEQLLNRDCEVTLLISPKEVDQEAVKAVSGMRIATLPAVALTRGGYLGFAIGCWKSYRLAKALFKPAPPHVVLAMGGFTSAPPILAGRAMGAKTFLHESNTIPGRANRWLARFVNRAFIYFPQTAKGLRCQSEALGMPVRSQFLEPIDPVSARVALGLRPQEPVLLVMGGSQGASGINDLMVAAAPQLAAAGLQILHLTGARDFEKVQSAYAVKQCNAVVRPFLSEMDLALGAATVAVSRAGASSSAELAAMRLPAILIPYPVAADNHQYHNARAFVDCGAALMLEQKQATADGIAESILDLVQNTAAREAMQEALGKWHFPNAAEQIADKILSLSGLATTEASHV